MILCIREVKFSFPRLISEQDISTCSEMLSVRAETTQSTIGHFPESIAKQKLDFSFGLNINLNVTRFMFLLILMPILNLD